MQEEADERHERLREELEENYRKELKSALNEMRAKRAESTSAVESELQAAEVKLPPSPASGCPGAALVGPASCHWGRQTARFPQRDWGRRRAARRVLVLYRVRGTG